MFVAENIGGRPPKFKNKEEIQELINKYFEACKGMPAINGAGEVILDKHGLPIVTNSKPPTISGLALALGFTSRQALLNYQAKKEFCDTITVAKLMIEEYTETRLFDRDGIQGAKFSLTNNFRNWSDSPKNDSNADTLSKLDEVLGKIGGVV